MKNKYIKRIKRALSGILASLLLFTGSGLTASAAENRVIDLATPISDAGDIIKLDFDGSRFETNMQTFATTSDAENAGANDTYETAELGKTYTVTYQNAIDYFGKPLTIKMDVVYTGNFPKYRYEGDSIYRTGPSIIIGDSYKLYAYGRTSKEYNDGNIKVTTTFYDEDGNLFPFTGLYGILDADEADYLFDTTDRNIYYEDASFSPAINAKAQEYAEANGLDTASKQYLLTSEGFKRQAPYVDTNAEGTRYSTINYLNANFYITLKDESSFELNISAGDYMAGALVLPSLYALKTEQHATVKVIDQDTNTTLKTSDTLTGMTDDNVVYDVDANIDEYLKNGYKLVSNGVEGQRYDADTNTDQEFEVVLKHKTTTYTPETYKPGEPMNEDTTVTKIPADLELEKTVKRTIKYFIESTEGEKVGEVVEEVKLTRNVTIDNVTGEVVSYGEWIPENPNYGEQVTNELYGYTPDKPVVSETPVLSEDIEEIVIYTPNEQKAIIHFVDENDNELAENINTTGKTGKKIEADTEPTIKSLTDKGYELITNELESKPTYDNKDDEDQNYQLVFKPIIEKITIDNPKTPEDTMNPNGDKYPEGLTANDLTKTIKRVVHYVDENGNKMAEDVLQEVTLVREATINHVTKEVVYGDWNEAELEEVVSPTIIGYNADKLAVEKLPVKYDSKDVEETVIYKLQRFTVTFVDGFGTTLDVQPNIPYHGSAKAITDPTKDGYIFTGWEVSYSNITQDLTVTALWREVEIIDTFTVTFVDGQGNTLKVAKDIMLHGSVLAPEDPTREGYIFTGWDVQFDDITHDTIVTAQWIEKKVDKVTVVFLDGFGVMLDAQQIDKGEDAIAPTPTKEGYTFKGWDISYENVQEDIFVNALWEPNTFTVTFTDGFGTTLKVQDGIPMHGSADTPDTPVKEGYKFLGWDELYNNVTKDMTVTALWEKVARPVVNTGAGVPLVAGIVFLGVLAGGFYFLKKKEDK